MIEENILVQDDKPKYYIYRQMMFGRVQTGIVGCTSIDDYMNNVIKNMSSQDQQKKWTALIILITVMRIQRLSS